VGFGEVPALAWELFLIRILVLRGVYGASSFSSFFLAFQSPSKLHIRDVYISINKTRVQRASLEVSPLISIIRQFLRGQLTHIYIDRCDTDEKRTCIQLQVIVDGVIERLFFFSRNKEQSNTRFVRHSKKRDSCRKYRACHCRPFLKTQTDKPVLKGVAL